MPYQYILANLLADVDEALGVVFVDEEGETVDIAARQVAGIDLRLTAAYLGIYAQRVVSLTLEHKLGPPSLLFIERRGLTILASTLSGGYCVGVVQGSSRAVGRTIHCLRKAAADLDREVLSEIDE